MLSPLALNFAIYCNILKFSLNFLYLLHRQSSFRIPFIYPKFNKIYIYIYVNSHRQKI